MPNHRGTGESLGPEMRVWPGIDGSIIEAARRSTERQSYYERSDAHPAKPTLTAGSASITNQLACTTEPRAYLIGDLHSPPTELAAAKLLLRDQEANGICY